MTYSPQPPDVGPSEPSETATAAETLARVRELRGNGGWQWLRNRMIARAEELRSHVMLEDDPCDDHSQKIVEYRTLYRWIKTPERAEAEARKVMAKTRPLQDPEAFQ